MRYDINFALFLNNLLYKMKEVAMVSVILPSYDPSDKLIKTVETLTEAGFDDIIIIDDGSSEECQAVFEAVAAKPCVTLLRHEKNMGKGRGLKTGFSFFLENRNDRTGVVTVDDDLQQNVKDIISCAGEMEKSGEAVFGARDFKSKNVPSKNKMGNNITAFVFRAFCGIKISDTQTGLRALPSSYLPSLCEVGGERFEYETNMLLEMKKRGLTFHELPIETIYIEGNKSSHFRYFRDSVKIYTVILKYMFSSIGAAIIDLAVFTLLNLLLPKNMEEWIRIFTATAAARIISSAVNYTVNRRGVFKSRNKVRSSLIKYYILCVCQAAISYGMVYLITFFTGTTQSLLQTIYKMIIDIALFFLCFAIQREWVFKEDGKNKNEVR